MIRTIVMRFDDKGDSACLDKDDNFFIEDSIRSLLNDISAIKDGHNGEVEITEIGNLEKEEYNAITKLDQLPEFKKKVIRTHIISDITDNIEEIEEMFRVGEKPQLEDFFGKRFAQLMTNADPLFDKVCKAIYDYVEEIYGDNELIEPSYNLEDLADHITMALKGKA